MSALGASRDFWQHLVEAGMAADLLPVVCDLAVPIRPGSKLSALGKVPSAIDGQGMAHGFKNWTRKVATADEIEAWSSDDRLGICMQMRQCKVFDVDIEDQVLADQVEDLLRPFIADLAGVSSDRVPLRYRENSSKFALIVRCDAALPKRVIGLDGTNKIEFLGNGQQAMIAGTHPSGSRINWEILPTEAPTLTADQINTIWSRLEEKFGAEQSSIAALDDFTAGREPCLGLTVEEMEALLASLDPDMGRDEWIRVGMALHHECKGDDTGFAIWDDWSSNGGKYTSEEHLRVQWGSFKLVPGKRSVTMATVMKMAREAQKPLLAEDVRNLWEGVADDQQGHSGVMTPEGYTGKFRIYHVSHPDLHKPMEWFIKGVLPKSDLIVLYGASGSGKSFVAFDMAAAIARGIPWQGCRVKRAKVVFVVAEGAGGMKNRVNAYCQHHGLEPADLDIGFVLAAPNVLDNGDVSELAKSIKLGGADIFVIDTFAQVTPGANENSGEDMGVALRNLRTITELTGATAWVIHHSGKDAARGARGWSGIRAAADAEIEISVSGSGRLISLTKMKDGDDSKRWGFRLATVALGTDSDGDPISSCVVEYVDRPRTPIAAPPEPKGATEKRVLETARACGAATPEGALSTAVIGGAVNAIPYDPAPPEGAKRPRDQRRSHVVRALSRLCDKGFLVTVGERLFVPGFQHFAGYVNVGD
ncbi:AAA family ATPase [Novosphingobium aerophilum]|uniref:AAA family ATPase n=1 Tax=Novosphingobium aerophilum TaxID=2839843 RepID=A0A7X1F8G8_9SPHN|nr:AAA family ATPase [Novosphingobium aerophilum]MBC2652362.1 AAA family ATPase [Novosphingobium aerophilum]